MRITGRARLRHRPTEGPCDVLQVHRFARPRPGGAVTTRFVLPALRHWTQPTIFKPFYLPPSTGCKRTESQLPCTLRKHAPLSRACLTSDSSLNSLNEGGCWRVGLCLPPRGCSVSLRQAIHHQRCHCCRHRRTALTYLEVDACTWNTSSFQFMSVFSPPLSGPARHDQRSVGGGRPGQPPRHDLRRRGGLLLQLRPVHGERERGEGRLFVWLASIVISWRCRFRWMS